MNGFKKFLIYKLRRICLIDKQTYFLNNIANIKRYVVYVLFHSYPLFLNNHLVILQTTPYSKLSFSLVLEFHITCL